MIRVLEIAWKSRWQTGYRSRSFLAMIGLVLAIAGIGFGQTPDEHSKHHPAPGGSPPSSAAPTAAPSGAPAGAMAGMSEPTPAPAAGGMAAGMGEMMKQMGVPPRKELYPSLMALPNDVTPEQRAGIEQLAQERMKSGAARLSSGLQKLTISASGEDYEAMQQASAQMREGLAEFESGIAARRVLSEGKAPRNLALDWFKREMNLAAPVRPEKTVTILGVTPFHLFTMALLISFALAMVAMYFFKMRRSAALFGRIDPDAKAPPAGAPEPAPPVVPGSGGSSAAPVPGGDAANSAAKPSAHPGAGSSTVSPVIAPDGGDAEKIAGRAVELWQARGGPTGSPQIDWLRAEEELAKPDEKPTSPAKVPPAPEASSAAHVNANWKGKLRVGSIKTEAPGVKTFRFFASSNDRSLPFTFVPGQFLNIAFWIGGAKMNRSYSISSSPTQREYVELTVRREPRGAVSRHFADLLKLGDQIEAGGPVGKFTFTGVEADSIVLISAGVGITPMMSIARYLTERSWPGDIFFVYTCHFLADFIFADELASLARLNPKLHLLVTISKPEGTDWKGPRGRITREWLTQSVPDLAARRVHVCGPPSMMESIKAFLTEIGVPPERLKTESFGTVKPTPAPPGTTATPTAPATGPLVTFAKNNKSAKIHLDLKSGDSPPKQTILELSEELGIGIEFSCRVGTCGVCKVKMTYGEVEMEVQDALDDNDKANKLILACQAKPIGEVAVEA